MNLKDAFWNWVVTHAQTIQSVDMHLACLEMRVARINFDLTFYVVWLRLPMPRYNNKRLKNLYKIGWKRDLIAWSNLNRAVIRIGVSEFGNFFVTLPGLNTGI